MEFENLNFVWREKVNCTKMNWSELPKLTVFDYAKYPGKARLERIPDNLEKVFEKIFEGSGWRVDKQGVIRHICDTKEQNNTHIRFDVKNNDLIIYAYVKPMRKLTGAKKDNRVLLTLVPASEEILKKYDGKQFSDFINGKCIFNSERREIRRYILDQNTNGEPRVINVSQKTYEGFAKIRKALENI